MIQEQFLKKVNSLCQFSQSQYKFYKWDIFLFLMLTQIFIIYSYGTQVILNCSHFTKHNLNIQTKNVIQTSNDTNKMINIMKPSDKIMFNVIPSLD